MPDTIICPFDSDITITAHEPSFRAKLVARRTYQRPTSDGGFETWNDVAARVVSHQRWLWERAKKAPLNAAEETELQVLGWLIENRAAFMAGRTLWLGGTDVARRREAAMLNCTHAVVHTVHDVVDIYWLLLQGAGTGFQPMRGALSGFLRPHAIEIVRSTRTRGDGLVGRPDNHETVRDGVWRISVGDSAEAWAKLIGKILAGKHDVHTLVIDFREVRAAGERLGQYGWISSGDAQIAESVRKVCAIMNSRPDDLLSRIDILDIVNLLGETLSSRRSAQIALVPMDDVEADAFSMAKKDCFMTGKAHRGQSNNSLLLTRRPTKAELRGFFATMVDAGGSEPGFINTKVATERAPWFSGVNPCFSHDTRILTRQGPRAISTLVGEVVEVWDGHAWRTIDNFRVTGTDQPMLKITMQDGATLRVTPAHRMVLADGSKTTAGELEVGQRLMLADVEAHGTIDLKGAYLAGFLLGDGTTHNGGKNPGLWLYAPKIPCRSRLIDSALDVDVGPVNTSAIRDVTFSIVKPGVENMSGLSVRPSLLPWCGEYRAGLPESTMQWTAETKRDFIAGLFDADGTALDGPKGFGYQFSTTSRRVAEDVQVLLKSIGVRAKLAQSHDAGDKVWADGAVYRSQKLWRLSIGQTSAVALARQVRFERLVSFADRALTYNTKTRAGSIVDIQMDGIDDKVYCCTVPGTHTVTTADLIVTGQCGEQILANGGVCNLTEVVLPRFVGMGSLDAALRVIARANYRATLINLDDGILQRRWTEINEHLRLCGVGLTGVDQWLSGIENPRQVLAAARATAKAAARQMARELRTAAPKHVTTIKPSGTLSKVADCTEGVHQAIGPKVINTIMLSEHDPLVAKLKAARYRVRPHPTLLESVLVEVPVHMPGASSRPLTAVEQLDRYKLMMEVWCDANCSITVSYDQSEVRDIVEWLHANWDTFVGVSFLPRVDATKTAEELGYAYLPQAIVPEEEFDAYAAQLLPIDLDDDRSNVIVADDCASGACPVR
ncbi:MAG: LAGLIDADG family homing endonuclease [Brooklawnia sp.]